MAVELDKLVQSPFLDDRLKLAIELGKRVASGVVETEDDLEMKLRIQLADHYGMPIMDPYFDRPVEHLLFEAVIISERASAAAKTPEDKIRSNLDEAAKYAESGWEDPPGLSDSEKQKMKDFMTTGRFVGE